MTIDMNEGWPQNPRKLRELATWYRGFAERTGNPTIWEARLRTAAELEKEADRLERASDRRRYAGHVGCDCDASPGVARTGSRRRAPSAQVSTRLRTGSLSS